MATERNVVDFKIHNLTEEQFQELKAQGKIDPNAVYCTPDESLKTDQITNCITEIPQDIKLELNNGTLTLKAGSKVYVPNGAGVFIKKTATTDVTTQNLSSYSNGQYLVFDNSDLAGTSLRCNLISACHSGTTAPATGTVWYDTTNNKIVVASGSTWTGNRTLPLGVITISNGAITSIDQVFNGFGYIGSTIFALPGVKGLMPNGRNEDGTLKNTAINGQIVKTTTLKNAYSATLVAYNNGALGAWSSIQYDPVKNITYNNSTPKANVAMIGKCAFGEGGRVTLFEVNQPFHAVDYSDFESTVEEINNSIEETNNSISAVDSSAVHKTGNETVADIKTFTHPTRKTTSLERGVVPSTNTNVAATQFMDKNSKVLGELEYFYGTNGKNGMSLLLYDSSGNRGAGLRIGQNSDGTTYASAPTPASTSNSTDVATTAWANAKFLPLAGGTMTGAITRGGTNLAKRNVDNSYLEIDGGTTYLKGAYLRLDGMSNGDFSGRFTLATGDGSKNIMLVGKTDGSLNWNSKPVVATEAKSLAQNGYVKFNNGLIIQWGLTPQGNQWHTITFPTPFSSASSYSVVSVLNGKSNYASCVYDRTNTTFTIDPSYQSTSADKRAFWIAIGY